MKKPDRNAGATMVIRVASVLIAGGAIVGCFGAGQNEPSDTTTATVVDSPSSDAAAESAPAAPVQASRPLPDGYPRDAAPIYQPSTITNVFKMGADSTLKYMVMTETGDSIDVVAASLADDYRSRGASVSVTPLNEKGTGQVTASRDGYGIIMTYSAGETPGTTTITYDVHKQRGRG